jgi:hypothetical protein
MVCRKNELRKFLIDHPLDPEQVEAAARRVSLALVTFRQCLSRSTMPKYVHLEYVRLGIPSHLLPPPTKTKDELQAENKILRQRLARYEPEFSIEQAVSSVEAQM